MTKELCLFIVKRKNLHNVMLRVNEDIISAHVAMQYTTVLEANLMGWKIINDFIEIDICRIHLSGCRG